jgi:hypothetical protein
MMKGGKLLVKEKEDQGSRYMEATVKVDVDHLETLGRSISLLLLHRRCASCWRELINEPNQGLDIDAKSHLKQITGHCSKDPVFISHGMPMLEAVFRILLIRKYGPISINKLVDALQEMWTDPTNPSLPSPEKIYRMLKGDRYYGIVLSNLSS